MPRCDVRLRGGRAWKRRFGDNRCAGRAELQVRAALVRLGPAERREQARQQDPEVDECETCEQRDTGADRDQCVLHGERKRERVQAVELHGRSSKCPSDGISESTFIDTMPSRQSAPRLAAALRALPTQYPRNELLMPISDELLSSFMYLQVRGRSPRVVGRGAMSSAITSFADLLRHLRTSASLSQEELAVRSGLSLRGISDLERGVRRAPHLTTVRVLADALALGPADRQALLAAARPGTGPEPADAAPDGYAPLPLPLTSLLGRERELTDARLPVAGRRYPVGDPDRRRGVGQDPPRPGGRRPAAGRVRRWRRLRRSDAAARCRVRPPDHRRAPLACASGPGNRCGRRSLASSRRSSCCSCWTTASRSSRRRRKSPPWWRPARGSQSSPRAGQPCGCVGSVRCRSCRCRCR